MAQGRRGAIGDDFYFRPPRPTSSPPPYGRSVHDTRVILHDRALTEVVRAWNSESPHESRLKHATLSPPIHRRSRPQTAPKLHRCRPQRVEYCLTVLGGVWQVRGQRNPGSRGVGTPCTLARLKPSHFPLFLPLRSVSGRALGLCHPSYPAGYHSKWYARVLKQFREDSRSFGVGAEAPWSIRSYWRGAAAGVEFFKLRQILSIFGFPPSLPHSLTIKWS